MLLLIIWKSFSHGGIEIVFPITEKYGGKVDSN